MGGIFACHPRIRFCFGPRGNFCGLSLRLGVGGSLASSPGIRFCFGACGSLRSFSFCFSLDGSLASCTGFGFCPDTRSFFRGLGFLFGEVGGFQCGHRSGFRFGQYRLARFRRFRLCRGSGSGLAGGGRFLFGFQPRRLLPLLHGASVFRCLAGFHCFRLSPGSGGSFTLHRGLHFSLCLNGFFASLLGLRFHLGSDCDLASDRGIGLQLELQGIFPCFYSLRFSFDSQFLLAFDGAVRFKFELGCLLAGVEDVGFCLFPARGLLLNPGIGFRRHAPGLFTSERRIRLAPGADFGLRHDPCLGFALNAPTGLKGHRGFLFHSGSHCTFARVRGLGFSFGGDRFLPGLECIRLSLCTSR